MKKIKGCLLTGFLFTVLLLSQTKVFACTMCMEDGWCHWSEQTCADWVETDYPNTSCTDDVSIKYNPNKDYILLTKTGQAFLVTGKIKMEIMSDALTAFFNQMKEKYGRGKKDKATQQKMVADLTAFRKRENKSVSTERLAKISEKLNLKVRKA